MSAIDRDLERRIEALERLLGEVPVRLAPAGGGQAIVQHAKVQSVDDDILVCNLYDPVAGSLGRQVVVAKPWELRRTPFDGQQVQYFDGEATIEYTYDTQRRRLAERGEVSQYEVVRPDYISNGVILIVYGRTGLVSGDPVVWTDQNNAGRAWAKEDA